MSTIDIDDDDFSLVIDQSNTAPTFAPPTGWHSETHVVTPLSAQVHLRPAGAPETSAPALLTLPDVGQSDVALVPFLSYCRTNMSAPIDAAIAQVHFGQPGHTHNAADLDSDLDLSIPSLAAAVLSLVDLLSLPRVIGFGVGLGAAVMLEAAAERPRAFAGLVLISPTLSAASTFQRLGARAEGLFTRGLGLGLSRQTRERFATRWLSNETREDNTELETSLLDDVERLNAHNVVRMLTTESTRTDALEEVKKVKAKTLIVTGKLSTLRQQVADRIPDFDPSMMAWLDVPDSGSLVHDEFPDRVAEAFSLFLQGLPGFS